MLLLICSLVVLFDKSDVFLEERTQADLQRNALVSAFLRVLKYYDGSLILTTNRGTRRCRLSLIMHSKHVRFTSR